MTGFYYYVSSFQGVLSRALGTTPATRVPPAGVWPPRGLQVGAMSLALGTAQLVKQWAPNPNGQSEFSPRIWELQLTKEVSLSLGV